MVAVAAGPLPVGRAGLAWEVGTEGVAAVLVVAVEAEVGMCGPPDADDRDAECRGEVHVGGIHADHEGEVAYDVEFFGEGVFTGEGGDRGGELGSEGFELRGFVFAAKEEYTVAGRGEHGGELAGVFPRPYLGLVLGKGSEADGVFGVRRSAFGVVGGRRPRRRNTSA